MEYDLEILDGIREGIERYFRIAFRRNRISSEIQVQLNRAPNGLLRIVLVISNFESNSYIANEIIDFLRNALESGFIQSSERGIRVQGALIGPYLSKFFKSRHIFDNSLPDSLEEDLSSDMNYDQEVGSGFRVGAHGSYTENIDESTNDYNRVVIIRGITQSVANFIPLFEGNIDYEDEDLEDFDLDEEQLYERRYNLRERSLLRPPRYLQHYYMHPRYGRVFMPVIVNESRVEYLRPTTTLPPEYQDFYYRS